jgi:hypothetical protein
MEIAPKRRGGRCQLTKGLEEVGAAPEGEIGAAALRRRSVLRCGGAAVREERKGGALGGEEMVPPLYRAEREREEARLRRGAARSVAAGH